MLITVEVLNHLLLLSLKVLLGLHPHILWTLMSAVVLMGHIIAVSHEFLVVTFNKAMIFLPNWLILIESKSRINLMRLAILGGSLKISTIFRLYFQSLLLVED